MRDSSFSFIARSILFFTILVVSSASPVFLYAEDLSYLEESAYVEVFEGDMPLIFAVGHGGWKQVGDQPNASIYTIDPLLRDYFYEILLPRIYEKTGHLPYVVYQQGQRNYVNTNRPVDHSEAYYPDNVDAKDAYFAFHNQLDAMVTLIESEYGEDMGILVNPHTADLPASKGNRPWDRIAEIGFITSVENLDSSSNTMKALYTRRGEMALIGENSIPYQFFHGQDWPSSDAIWPAAAITNAKTLAKDGADVWHILPAWVTDWETDAWVSSYFNGWSTIQYHGTNISGRHANWSSGIDAFQMEVNFTKKSGIAVDEPGEYKLDTLFVNNLMEDFIDAVLHSLRVNYNWSPNDAYNVIVDNGSVDFSTRGYWEESTGDGYWGTPSLYTNEVGATAKWTPDFAQTGIYEVLVRWTGYPNRTPSAQYTVNHVGGHQTLTLDQSANDARWISLGTFVFSEGMSGSVTLTSTDADYTTSADAVMFRLLSPEGDVYLYLPMIFKNGGSVIELGCDQ